MSEYIRERQEEVKYLYIIDIDNQFSGISRMNSKRVSRNFKLNERLFLSNVQYKIMPKQRYGLNTKDIKEFADRIFPHGNYSCYFTPDCKAVYICELTNELNDYTESEKETLKKINVANAIKTLFGNEIDKIFEKYGLRIDKNTGRAYFKEGMLDKFVKECLDNTLIKDLKEVGIDTEIIKSKHHSYKDAVLEMNTLKLIE